MWQRRQIRGYSEKEERIKMSMLAEHSVFTFSVQNHYMSRDVNTFDTGANTGYYKERISFLLMQRVKEVTVPLTL